MAEKKWFPLHPSLHPSPQQQCSSSGTSQAEKFRRKYWKKNFSNPNRNWHKYKYITRTALLLLRNKQRNLRENIGREISRIRIEIDTNTNLSPEQHCSSSEKFKRKYWKRNFPPEKFMRKYWPHKFKLKLAQIQIHHHNSIAPPQELTSREI